MWYWLKNFFYSLRTYPVISPDLRVRQQVNRSLCRRPEMKPREWFESFYQPQGVAYRIVKFAYTRLGHYSGLGFGRVLPTDRLQEDLHWYHVCWFDWEMSLCDDFYREFGVDLSLDLEQLHGADVTTVGDLVKFLNQKVQDVNPQDEPT